MQLLKSFKNLKWEKNRFFVGLAFALFAFGFTFIFIQNRDLLFERKWTEGEGRFLETIDFELRKNAEDYVQKNGARKDDLCVSEWIGKDDQYLYMGIGCAKFSQNLGEITAEGDQNFHPTRLRFSGNEIEHFEQPDLENVKNSVRRLFPKKVYELYRLKAHQEKFFKRGWEKTLSLQR